MRFLKSFIPFAFVFCISTSRAQDTAFLPQDTSYVATEKDTTPIFQAERPSGTVVWQEHTIPDSTLQRLRRDEAFWYANAEFKHKTPPDGAGQQSFWFGLFRQQWFYNLLWAFIITSFIGVIVLFLMKSNPRLFRKKATTLTAIDEPLITENIFSINYTDEIKNAVAQKNFRAAVRLQYLYLLTILSGKELIRFKEGLTNSDYLMQLYPTPYYKGFKTLTRHFDYAWYGQFAIMADAYQTIETDFATFRNSMNI